MNDESSVEVQLLCQTLVGPQKAVTADIDLEQVVDTFQDETARTNLRCCFLNNA
jgi:hypothetical protein